MKVALLCAGDQLPRIEERLGALGVESISAQDATTLLAIAEQEPDIQVVLLAGEVDILMESQIRLLRRFPYYLYLVYLQPEGEAYRSELIQSGVDEFFPLHSLEKSINDRLFALERFFLAHSVDLDVIGLPKDRSNRQTLNLQAGLSFAEGDKGFYRTLIGVLLKNLEDLEGKLDQGPMDGWQNLAQNAISLGAEDLYDWTDDFFTHKRLRQRSNSSAIKRLKNRFSQLKRTLNIATEQLDEAGFFEGSRKKVTQDIFAGLKVLVVEDMQHNRLLLKHMLDRKDCVISEAVNGAKGLEKIKSEPVDVVLMDMNMPVMDGFEATRELRLWEKETGRTRLPVLALTALAMRGDKEKCIEVGCDAYLPKPIDADDLYRQVQGLLANPETGLGSVEPLGSTLKKLLTVAVFTTNQVYQFVLQVFCAQLGLKPQFLDKEVDLIEVVEKGEVELILLDQERNIKLAYLIRDQYPTQQLNLFGESHDRRGSSLNTSEHVIGVPFKIDQLRNILEFHHGQLEQRVQFSEIIEDFNSLKSMKGQTGIEELVSQSGGQIAAWQKAFRKIGGDLVLSQSFDYHGRLGLILADVSGHDVRSGYTASWFAGLIKGVWKNHMMPYDLLVYLNSHFYPDQLEEDKRYVCALVLLWDPVQGVLNWANAGIPGGILLRANGEREELNWRGVPIGMFPEMQVFDQGSVDLAAGDSMILATDGILEAVSGDLIQQLSLSGETPQDLLDQVVDFVMRSLEVKDDLTLTVFKPAGSLLPEGGYRGKMHGTMEETYEEVKRIKQYLDTATSLDFDWAMSSVAIKEALMNAVEHGNKGNPDKDIWVDVWVEGNQLVVRVSDEGRGFDLLMEKKRLEAEGDLRIQGRGLHLMENIAKKVKYLGSGVEMVFETVEKAF